MLRGVTISCAVEAPARRYPDRVRRRSSSGGWCGRCCRDRCGCTGSNLVGVAGSSVTVLVLVGQMVAEGLVAGLARIRGCLGAPHAGLVLGLLIGHLGVVLRDQVLPVGIDLGRLPGVLLSEALLHVLRAAGLPLRSALCRTGNFARSDGICASGARIMPPLSTERSVDC